MLRSEASDDPLNETGPVEGNACAAMAKETAKTAVSNLMLEYFFLKGFKVVNHWRWEQVLHNIYITPRASQPSNPNSSRLDSLGHTTPCKTPHLVSCIDVAQTHSTVMVRLLLRGQCRHHARLSRSSEFGPSHPTLLSLHTDGGLVREIKTCTHRQGHVQLWSSFPAPHVHLRSNHGDAQLSSVFVFGMGEPGSE